MAPTHHPTLPASHMWRSCTIPLAVVVLMIGSCMAWEMSQTALTTDLPNLTLDGRGRNLLPGLGGSDLAVRNGNYEMRWRCGDATCVANVRLRGGEAYLFASDPPDRPPYVKGDGVRLLTPVTRERE